MRKLAVLLGLALAGCDPSPVLDAGADAGPATPDAPPVTTDHCTYSELAPTGGSGGTVTAAPLSAGAAEDFIHIPLGVTLGAYAARVPIGGNEGFIDERRTEIASEFAPSVGIETWPRVRAVALSTGTAPDYEETMVIVKCDLGLSNQAILRAVEARLPPELAGKVIFATSHSHGAFANYVTDALQVAFGPYSQHIHDILVDDMVTTIERALAARRPATIGIARNGAFDTADRATRDRRGENDALPGGDVDDQNLFIIRVDEVDGDPIAVLPVFGVHGTILGADNVLVSTDAPGGVERVFEEHFDSEVVVIHLQGAGGDTSPAGIEGGTTTCPEGSVLCHDYGRAETVGFNALPEMLALYDVAGADMQTSVPMEMVTRSYERGPDQENFVVRDGALRYAPWDGVTPADGRIYDDTGAILSPIDEFNAPYGAALCATPDRVRALNRDAQIPGTAIPELANFPYSTCNRLEGVTRLFEQALQVDFSGPPLCDTTRALISAARIGDWYFSTIPGEPMVLGNQRLREIAPVDGDHLIIIGYAQDHHGYVMTAEDWLLMGYEPTITFWGPLDGEQIIEDAAALLEAVTTDAREDMGTGSDHVVPPTPMDTYVSDAAPMAGTVPATLPAYVTNRLLPGLPASANLPATAERLDSLFFTFIGEDPMEGTPIAQIEVDVEGDGTFEPLRRRSGRIVHDADFLLTWTPDPPSGVESATRTHYWTVEWQAVPPLGNPAVLEADEITARAGLPLGDYRMRVMGPHYEVTSSVVSIEATSLAVALSGSEITVTYQSTSGFRLLDATTGINGVVPVRSAPVDVEVTYAGGGTDTLSAVMLDASGHATLTGLTGTVASVVVTDRFGNTSP